MIFIASTLLTISINLLLVVFVIVCLMMSLLILMQRPKQEGLGAAFGGGVTDQVFGARTTNVLQKGTVYLGSLFFLLSLALAILIGKQTQQRTLLDDKSPVAKEESAAKKDSAPVAGTESPETKSLSEELPVDAVPTPPAAVPANDAADAAAEKVKEVLEVTPEEVTPDETPVEAVPEVAPEPPPAENNADKPE